jgi:excisionase family DNA binding protein
MRAPAVKQETTEMTDPERQTLTVEEAARALGCGRNAAYQGVRRGEIPSIRIGKRLLVPRAALERLLAEPAGSGPKAAA